MVLRYHFQQTVLGSPIQYKRGNVLGIDPEGRTGRTLEEGAEIKTFIPHGKPRAINDLGRGGEADGYHVILIDHTVNGQRVSSGYAHMFSEQIYVRAGDPVTAARIEAITARGGNAFAEYQVPLAILTLQQGLGRLIRHRADRGVLAILDPRVRTMGYGRRFLASLPPAPVTYELDAVERFFG